MGLLGKIQKNVRHAIADSLKRGREQGYSINNKLKRIASNIDNPIAAGALNGFIKFDELSAIPFRKMNEYLYDKLAPSTTDENKNAENQDQDKEIIRNRINAKRRTPTEALELQYNDDE